MAEGIELAPQAQGEKYIFLILFGPKSNLPKISEFWNFCVFLKIVFIDNSVQSVFSASLVG